MNCLSESFYKKNFCFNLKKRIFLFILFHCYSFISDHISDDRLSQAVDVVMLLLLYTPYCIH